MLRAALKSLLGRKVRLFLSTFAIVLGVAFVAGSLVFSDTLDRSFTALFASTVGDVVVRPEGGAADVRNGPSTRTVPASVLADLEDVDGAARVDGNVTDLGVFVVDADNKVVGGQGPPGIGGNWSDAPAGHGLEGLSIVEGVEPRGPDEVVLDASTAERAGYGRGDRVHLVTAGDQAVLNPVLVGIADFEQGGSLNGATYAAFDTRTAQQVFLGGEDAYTDLWVTAEDGVSQEELRDAVAPRLPDGLEAVTGDVAADENASDLVEAISFLTTFLLIFAGIALVVGAFLIVNTFSILVAQRSRELALLRALGASRRQVTGSVLLESFVLGVLGSTVGLGLGVVLAVVIRLVVGRFGLDLSEQPLVFEARTVLAAYAIGIVVTMAAAWLPARRSARIAPVQALRDDISMPETSLRRRFLGGLALIAAGCAALAAGLFTSVSRGGWFVGGGVLAVLLGVASASPVLSRPFLAVARSVLARLFGTVGHLAGQNSLRNPRRTTATASALMIGLALAATMAIVGDSAKASVDQTIEENFTGDYVVSNLMGQPFSSGIGTRMAAIDGVETVARQRFAIGETADGPQGVGASDRSSLAGLLDLDMTSGSLDDLGLGTVVTSDEYADEHGLDVGDELEVSFQGQERSYPVVGTFAENPLVGYPIVTTLDTLAEAGFPDRDNFLVIDVDRQTPELEAAIDAVVADLPIVTVKDQVAFAEEQRGPIDQLVLMIFALLGLALFIAVLGIVNTLALSVIERTREVGLLRAVGLGRAQLRWMVTFESVVIAVLGAVLGSVLGVGFGIAMMYALRDEGLEVIAVPWDQLAAFLAVSVVVGVLAAVLPARRAARLDVLKAIATE
ncbi:ABC transporter permease [Nocardioides sp. LHG3406-4]|uniref:ABC transporter permease n=1 Tax=Nocardioides sp. LHG3406-4 TaxID=2804575 RepID=UPI003CF36F5D